MCMFCAAVPVVAATGTALDNKQRKVAQAEEDNPKHLRPYGLITTMVIFLLLVGSVIVHTRYGWLWL
jgi:hypothetical protein